MFNMQTKAIFLGLGLVGVLAMKNTNEGSCSDPPAPLDGSMEPPSGLPAADDEFRTNLKDVRSNTLDSNGMVGLNEFSAKAMDGMKQPRLNDGETKNPDKLSFRQQCNTTKGKRIIGGIAVGLMAAGAGAGFHFFRQGLRDIKHDPDHHFDTSHTCFFFLSLAAFYTGYLMYVWMIFGKNNMAMSITLTITGTIACGLAAASAITLMSSHKASDGLSNFSDIFCFKTGSAASMLMSFAVVMLGLSFLVYVLCHMKKLHLFGKMKCWGK